MANHAIDDILEQWSVDGYHLQHYWALLARSNIDIFRNSFRTNPKRLEPLAQPSVDVDSGCAQRGVVFACACCSCLRCEKNES